MTEIRPAMNELLALAREVRPDWDHEVLASAVLAARSAGWTWVRTLLETARLMCREDASPWDLKRAAAEPLKPRPATGDAQAGASLARQLMAEKHRADGDPGSAA